MPERAVIGAVCRRATPIPRGAQRNHARAAQPVLLQASRVLARPQRGARGVLTGRRIRNDRLRRGDYLAVGVSWGASGGLGNADRCGSAETPGVTAASRPVTRGVTQW